MCDRRGDPSRVLHLARVINRYDFIDNVIRHADPAKFHMMACTFTAKSNIEPPTYETDAIPHFVLDVAFRAQYPLAIVRLARLLRRESVDLIHTHHFDEAFIGTLAARLAGKPATVIGRHYHDELYLAAGGTKLRALLAVEGFCNRLARMIVVPSRTIRELLVRRQGVPAEKVRVVPYGFDFAARGYRVPTEAEVLAFRREMGIEEAFVIGNFGRHHPLKGQDYLLRAYAKFVEEFPRAHLIIVGDGPSNGALRQLASDLGVSRQVLFTGWRMEASRLLRIVDVVVHPTLHEAFSQLMVEALVHQRPLIITDVSGTAECIEHGRTGILVPRRDAGAIHEALRWVASHQEEARAMGEEGRRYVLGELDIRQVIKRYHAAYDEALAEGTSLNASPARPRE